MQTRSADWGLAPLLSLKMLAAFVRRPTRYTGSIERRDHVGREANVSGCDGALNYFHLKSG